MHLARTVAVPPRPIWTGSQQQARGLRSRTRMRWSRSPHTPAFSVANTRTDHGVRDNTGYRFDPTHPTAATLLKHQGFATGAFIGGFPLDRRFGLSTGFDIYDDRLDASSSTETGHRERKADAVIESASDWLGTQQGRWLAWVHLYDPHTVYAAPPEWAARYPGSPYLAEVAWTDHALGALFDLVRQQPRNTLIIVTADHGEGLGDHGEATHGIFAYEATLRVPLIVAETQTRAGPPRRQA